MENNKIIIYQTEDGQTQIDVRLENETVWPDTSSDGRTVREDASEHYHAYW